MAVADAFTAISEDRPYRKGMNSEGTVTVLKTMVREKSVDENIVALLLQDISQINEIRLQAQNKSAQKYREVFPQAA
jgi:HD-GYP domain-containing protein (c-di-GMP phosphodiesterase class II)